MLWNFTKAEFYRATKMKSFYILLIVALVTTFFTSVTYLRFDKGMFGLEDAQQIEDLQSGGLTAENMGDSFSIGFEAGVSNSEAAAEEPEDIKIWGEGLFWGAPVSKLYCLTIEGLDALMLLSIFVGLFFGSVYSTGSDKNLVIGNSRKELKFAARMLVVLAYSFILQVTLYIWQLLCTAVLGAPVKLGLSGDLVKFFFYTWFLTFVFASIVATITTVTRSKAAGIALGVVFSMGILSMIISLVDLLVSKLTKLDSFSLADYTITNNIARMTLNSDGKYVIRALIVGLIYLVVSVTVIVLNNRKRDLC